jgi:hypothetical protein
MFEDAVIKRGDRDAVLERAFRELSDGTPAGDQAVRDAVERVATERKQHYDAMGNQTLLLARFSERMGNAEAADDLSAESANLALSESATEVGMSLELAREIVVREFGDAVSEFFPGGEDA